MIYLFKSNKKTGRKTKLGTMHSEAGARACCKEYNYWGGQYWYEFTSDPEYLKTGKGKQ